jgi:predicted phosphohydrolase
MRFKLVSDLHLEWSDFNVPYSGEDVLVVAGDISHDSDQAAQLIVDYLASAPDHVHVVACLGNHDYYGRSVAATDTMWRARSAGEPGALHPRFHHLQDASVVLGGYRFHGSTMWTDMTGDERALVDGISDFRAIDGFTVAAAREIHQRGRAALAEALDRSAERVVVVTHHLPLFASIAPQYAGSPVGGAFASTDMGDLVRHPNVAVWCHGHTHASVDIREGPTRVLCNPRGIVRPWNGHLRRPENRAFDPELVVELDDN